MTDTTQDFIRVFNSGGEHSIGLLIDGFMLNDPLGNSGIFVNDRSEILEYPLFRLNRNFTRGDHNEIIAFQRGRSPTLVENIKWTEASDTIDLFMMDQVILPVHFWVLITPFDDHAARIDQWVARANELFYFELVGIRLDSVKISEVSQPENSEFLTFGCLEAGQLIEKIGYDTAAMNFYLVEKLENCGRGHYCGSEKELIALSNLANGEVLAHEIGHTFGWQHNHQHVPEYFDGTNLMIAVGIYLTEGQAFMVQFSSLSYINRKKLRQDLPVRECFDSVNGTADCPPIQKRIWHDGTYGPN